MEGTSAIASLPPISVLSDRLPNDATVDGSHSGRSSIKESIEKKEELGRDPNENVVQTDRYPQAQLNIEIEMRNSSRLERKREILLEARKARIIWILSGLNSIEATESHQINVEQDPLMVLQACSYDGIPSAPDVIEALLSSRLYKDKQDKNLATLNVRSKVKNILDHYNLIWERVSKKSCLLSNEVNIAQIPTNYHLNSTKANDESSILTSVSIPHGQSYHLFLHMLCDPDSTDICLSIQNFCKTIEEAARVMISVQEEDRKKVLKSELETSHAHLASEEKSNKNFVNNTSIKHSPFNKTSERKIPQNKAVSHPTSPNFKSHHDHVTPLAQAVRGFINKTSREMEAHSYFKMFLDRVSNIESDGNFKNTAKDELLASLEKFVFIKCHSAIYDVLGGELHPVDDDNDIELDEDMPHMQNSSNLFASSNVTTYNLKTLREMDLEIYEKMRLLQFVTPEHLEIPCLKNLNHTSSPSEMLQSDVIIDLTLAVQQLRSIKDQSSPREMMRCILLAQHDLILALNAALDKENGEIHPPSADDILPTFILAVLRAHPENLISNLCFIDYFSTASLRQGETGYAYTNLCCAVQFIKKLDMEAHASEVSLGELGEGAILSISPDDFKAGIRKFKEEAKHLEKIALEVEKKDAKYFPDARQEDGETNLLIKKKIQMKISGRDIRNARACGEFVNLEWAVKKQSDYLLQHGEIQSTTFENTDDPGCVICLPPKEHPFSNQFARSYSYLTARPENIRLSDLPQLLKEYKMLVHVTETLLNERALWRTAEMQRQTEVSRSNLEKDYNDLIGQTIGAKSVNDCKKVKK